MIYLRILRTPSLALVWWSQLLSVVGDQLFSVAVVWLMVSRTGSNAGFVSAAGLVTGLTFGLLGGHFADVFDRRKTMMVVDGLRTAIVGALPVLALIGQLRLWTVFAAVVLVEMLGTLFLPSLQGALNQLCKDELTTNGMNALLESTQRLARIIGPAMTGLLVALLSIQGFFWLDSLTFAISAAILFTLKREFTPAISVPLIPAPTILAPLIPPPSSAKTSGVNPFLTEVPNSFRLLWRNRSLFRAIVSLGLVNIAWSTIFLLGTPLLVERGFHHGISDYGLLSAAYGIGNVLSLLFTVGSRFRQNIVIMYIGQVVMGLGFLVLSTAPTLSVAGIGIIIAAFGSPMGDLLLLNIIQRDFPPKQIGKIYSLRNLVSNFGLAIGLLASVYLYKVLPISSVMLTASVYIIFVGLIHTIERMWPSTRRYITRTLS
ncbi:MFS transporter [Alicyclobacillus curvatus]|nr:MFS transporter [Alicyclobacillus curvatus]